MTERKQTPDILSEILGGISTTSETKSELPTTPAPRQAAAAKKEAAAAKKGAGTKITTEKRPPAGKAQKWEYLIVTFQEHGKGWRPHYHNGVEIDDWTNAPLIHDYINDLSKEGWELAAASAGERLYASADRHQVYFKRPR